jgi:DNA repair protein RecN (Recombination protein N)
VEQHQVICITHLPQVAAFGDSHYAIVKLFSSERTRTNIQQLGNDERVDELAAMLDGTPISEHSRRSAQEMLERAQTFKMNGSQASQEPALAR